MLPSSGNPNPVGSPGGGDGDTDAGLTGDVTTSAAAPDVLPSVVTACDPLAQNCTDPTNACYPISGGGKCLIPSSAAAGPQGFCIQPNDCQAGLACIDTATMGTICMVICDVADSTKACGATGVCQPLASPKSVGYCL